MNLDELYVVAYNEGYRAGQKDAEANASKVLLITGPNATQKIMDIVCVYFATSKESLVSRSRRKNIVAARQMAMYLMRKHARLRLVEIGRVFGGRDHTSVIHSINTIKTEKEIYDNVAKDCAYLSDVIYDHITNNTLVSVKPKEEKKINACNTKAPVFKTIACVMPAELIEEKFTRPIAEYSNTGHLNLVKKYSEVGYESKRKNV